MRPILAAVVLLLLSACASSAPATTGAASARSASHSAYGEWEYVATSGGKRTTGRFCIARPPATSRFVVDAAGVDSEVTAEVFAIEGSRVTWRGIVASPGGPTAFYIDATFVGPAVMEGQNRLRQCDPPHREAAWTFVAKRPVD